MHYAALSASRLSLTVCLLLRILRPRRGGFQMPRLNQAQKVGDRAMGEDAIQKDITDFIVSNFLFGDRSRMPAEDQSLIEQGIVDSTGILELIEFVEEKYSIQVTEAETVPENLGSVANLRRFVASKKG